MSGKARIWIGSLSFMTLGAAFLLTRGAESAPVFGANPPSGQGSIFAGPQGHRDLTASMVVRSAYLNRSKEPGLKVTKASVSPLKMQLAAAVREADLAALQQLMGYEFGKDREADGLLIEGARKLALSGRTELVGLAESKIASYVALERARSTEADYTFGNLVQLAEALQDFRGPVALDLAFSLLQDRSMPRIVRGAAALSLGEMGHSGARLALLSYRNDLKEELSNMPATSSDREFMVDSIREVDEIIGRLN